MKDLGVGPDFKAERQALNSSFGQFEVDRRAARHPKLWERGGKGKEMTLQVCSRRAERDGRVTINVRKSFSLFKYRDTAVHNSNKKQNIPE